MLSFYKLTRNVNFQTLSGNMSWSHYVELLKMNDFFEINYYCRLSIQENLSVRELRTRIKNKEYERLDEETKEKIKNQSKKQEITDYIKNPIMIQNKNRYEEISEKVLQKIILEDIESFMKELGNYYSFIGSEYKIKIGDRNHYIDLLLFNIEYNSM